MHIASAKRAKVLFFVVKYADFWCSSRLRRSGCFSSLFFRTVKACGLSNSKSCLHFALNQSLCREWSQLNRISYQRLNAWDGRVGLANGFQESQDQDLLTLLMAFIFNDNFAVLEVIAWNPSWLYSASRHHNLNSGSVPVHLTFRNVRKKLIGQWPVSRKSLELFGSGKPFLKLQLTHSVKLVFSVVVMGRKIKITAKFRVMRRFRFEDTKRTMSPEMRPKSFGTFKKRAPVPSSPRSPFQDESKFEVFVKNISFHSYWS